MTDRAKALVNECKLLKSWGISDITVARITGLPTSATVRRLVSSSSVHFANTMAEIALRKL